MSKGESHEHEEVRQSGRLSFSHSSPPALAEQFYVVFDPASKKCEAMHNIPTGMKSMGTYGSMEEAKKAMATMKECG